ncbi:MAG: bifunctional phosphoribosylaminoimidazolecarboxamide formyltransferase/IMP cyclohydrolase [Gammaproteobacteria bacterium]
MFAGNYGYPVRRALISVADKTGIIELAQQLHILGIALMATGNTAAIIREQSIPVTEVSDYTKFPEIMGGRVKTLHPKIHGGILARRDQDENVLKQHEIELIDLVIINLYPFAQTIQKPDCTYEQAVEQIDVGGPAMLRAAAKNHKAVTVIIDPQDYALVLSEIQQNNGHVPFSTRQQLAQKAFAYTARYDGMIAEYLAQQLSPLTAIPSQLPETLTLNLHQTQSLRYGENPQQAAALYSTQANHAEPWQLRQGKPLSFNNLVDADVAWCCVKTFNPAPACVIVKHANPCGVAVGTSLIAAYQLAFATDKTSAFGGIIAFNQTVDAATCHTILEQQFVEVIIAPDFTTDALDVLKTKPNIRALAVNNPSAALAFPYDIKCLSNGLLLQELDQVPFHRDSCRVVTTRVPSAEEWQDLVFAWQVVKWVKSNAIVYAKDQRTIGIGAGQTSRVCSAEFGILKAAQAELSVNGAVVASDAFYPFRDGVDKAAQAGVTAIIQPGGSMRDPEVISAANEHGLAMVFTDVRHFRH